MPDTTRHVRRTGQLGLIPFVLLLPLYLSDVVAADDGRMTLKMRFGNRWIGPAIGLLLVLNTGAWLGAQMQAARPINCAIGPRLSALALDTVGAEIVAVRVIVEPA